MAPNLGGEPIRSPVIPAFELRPNPFGKCSLGAADNHPVSRENWIPAFAGMTMAGVCGRGVTGHLSPGAPVESTNIISFCLHPA